MREHFVVPPIRSQDGACTQRSGVRRCVGRGTLRLAAPKSTPVLIGSLHNLSRPQQQGLRSVNPFTLVPAIPSGALHVNAVGGSERRSRNSQEARLCPRPRYRVPSFCCVPGESRRRQPPTGKSRHIFASTEIIAGALRDGILPTITHLRPNKLLRKDAFQKGFATPLP